MSDAALEKLVATLVGTLREIRDEIKCLRSEGPTKPLPRHTCMRCDKTVPCERIGIGMNSHVICLHCLEVTLDELHAILVHQKTTLLHKALERGESSIHFGLPVPSEETAKDSIVTHP